MKVQFNVNSGANIYSTHESGWFDTVEELGMDEGEWEAMSDDEKYKEAEIWAENYLEIYYEEKE